MQNPITMFRKHKTKFLWIALSALLGFGCEQNEHPGFHTESIELEHGLGTLTIDLPDYFEAKKKCYHHSDIRQGERVEWWFSRAEDLDKIQDTSGFAGQLYLDSIPMGYFYTSQNAYPSQNAYYTEPDEFPISFLENWLNAAKGAKYSDNYEVKFVKDTILEKAFLLWYEENELSYIHGRTYSKGKEIRFTYTGPTQNQELLHSFYEAALTVKVETP
ncbi:MAG: hypothetical protein SchgKO_10940 [Schleiferiaceae bacterium]